MGVVRRGLKLCNWCGDPATLCWPVKDRRACLPCVMRLQSCVTCSRPKNPDDRGHWLWTPGSVAFVCTECEAFQVAA